MDIADFLEKTMAAAGGGKPEEYSPLALAYLGDAVFELLVRSRVISGGNAPSRSIAKKARGFVNAQAQSAFYDKILPTLTPEEEAALKRGRNAKSSSRAKNATVLDYRRATGVEALFGHLFLQSKTDRIIEIFSMLDSEPDC